MAVFVVLLHSGVNRFFRGDVVSTDLSFIQGSGSSRVAVTRPDLPAEAAAAVRGLLRHSIPGNTAAAVRSDWLKFETWCSAQGFDAFPAHGDLVCWFVTSKAAEVDENGCWLYSPATVSRWVSSINARHTVAGYEAPGRSGQVVAALRALRRSRAAVPARRSPLLVEDIRTIVATARRDAVLPERRVSERRDAALLLLGFSGALRRSELVALTDADVSYHPSDGLYVNIRRSKTDKASAGRTVTLPFGESVDSCPVCAYVRWVEVLQAWQSGGRDAVLRLVESSGVLESHVCGSKPSGAPVGDLFRRVAKSGSLGAQRISGQSVCSIVKRRAEQAGFPEDTVSMLGAHSLRAGFVTQAVRAGATTQMIMTQTGHTDERMVRLYSRQNAGLVGNAVAGLGL